MTCVLCIVNWQSEKEFPLTGGTEASHIKCDFRGQEWLPVASQWSLKERLTECSLSSDQCSPLRWAVWAAAPQPTLGAPVPSPQHRDSLFAVIRLFSFLVLPALMLFSAFLFKCRNLWHPGLCQLAQLSLNIPSGLFCSESTWAKTTVRSSMWVPNQSISFAKRNDEHELWKRGARGMDNVMPVLSTRGRQGFICCVTHSRANCLGDNVPISHF